MDPYIIEKIFKFQLVSSLQYFERDCGPKITKMALLVKVWKVSGHFLHSSESANETSTVLIQDVALWFT